MSLKKGFLRGPDFKVNKWLLAVGILLSSLVSFYLYSIFIFCAEVLRSEVVGNRDQLLLLTQVDVFFYSYSIAFLTSTFGQGFGLQMVLAFSRRPRDFKTRFRLRNLQSQISVNFWVFLYWVTKWLGVMGVAFIAFEVHYDLDLKKEYGYLFFLLPMVLFLSFWLGAYKLFKGKILRWMIIGLVHVVVTTLMVGSIRLVDYDLNNERLNFRSPITRHAVNLPGSETRKRLHTWDYIDLLLFTDQNEVKVLFPYSDFTPISLDDSQIIEQLEQETQKFTYGWKLNSKIKLTIDSAIILKDVLVFEDVLRTLDFGNIYYRTKGKNSIYPWHHPQFRNAGMPKWLGYACNFEKTKVDSIKQLGYKAEQVRWPDLPCYEMDWVLKQNRVLVRHEQDGMYLNNKKLKYHQTAESLIKIVKKYPEIVLLYQPSPDLSFGQYIHGRDILMQAVIKNRISWAQKQFDQEYDYYLPPEWLRYTQGGEVLLEARRKYPMYIYELTGWNLEFYNYLKE